MYHMQTLYLNWLQRAGLKTRLGQNYLTDVNIVIGFTPNQTRVSIIYIIMSYEHI